MLFISWMTESVQTYLGGPVKISAFFVTDVWTENAGKKEVTTPEAIMYIPGISVNLQACQMWI